MRRIILILLLITSILLTAGCTNYLDEEYQDTADKLKNKTRNIDTPLNETKIQNDLKDIKKFNETLEIPR